MSASAHSSGASKASSSQKQKEAAALQLAIALRKPASVERLLSNGADPAALAPGSDEPLLLYALRVSAFEVAEIFHRFGRFDFNAPGSGASGEPMLISALQRCPENARAIAWLLERGANPNATARDQTRGPWTIPGLSALQLAASLFESGAASLLALLNAGARHSYERHSNPRHNPLLLALSRGESNHKACDALIAANAQQLAALPPFLTHARITAEASGNARALQAINATLERQALDLGLPPSSPISVERLSRL